MLFCHDDYSMDCCSNSSQPIVYNSTTSICGRSSASSVASTGSQESWGSQRRSTAQLAQTVQKNLQLTEEDQSNLLDDSLTNLNWLHNVNPMKINEQLNVGNYPHTIVMKYPKDKIPSSYYNNKHPHTHHQRPNKNTTTPTDTINYEYFSSTDNNNNKSVLSNYIDYSISPIKPPFNYATLISLAMKDLNKPKITLSDIYSWIQSNFAYYRYSDLSWQNSVRHNLSLGKCFEKVPRRKDEPGKGGFWRINPLYSRTLDMNLSKIKYKLPSCEEPQEVPLSGIAFEGGGVTSNNSGSGLCSNQFIMSSCSTKKPRKSPLTVTRDWSDEFEVKSEQQQQQYHHDNSNIFPYNTQEQVPDDCEVEVDLLTNFDGDLMLLDKSLADDPLLGNDDIALRSSTNTSIVGNNQFFNQSINLQQMHHSLSMSQQQHLQLQNDQYLSELYFLNSKDSLMDLNTMLDIP